MSESAGVLELIGAGGFGVVVGWLLYHLNRHRTDVVRLADLVTIIGAIGGAAILALFPSGSDLFGAYGIGLFVGFFGYLATLIVLVHRTDGFTWAWFLDGRRPALGARELAGDGQRPMNDEPELVG